MLREVGLAYYFGTSAAADRFSAAFAVAGVASLFVGEAAYATFIRTLGSDDSLRSHASFAAILKRTLTAGLMIAGVFAVLGPLITFGVLGGADSDPKDTVFLSLLLAPAVGAIVPIGLFNARLTIERRYTLTTAIQVLYSAGAVAGIALIATGAVESTWPIAAGWSLGNLGALLVLWMLNRSRAGERESGSRFAWAQQLRTALPIASAYLLLSMQELSDRAVASRLGTGNLAALSYANRLFLLPLGFVMAAFGPMVIGTLTTGSASMPSALGELASGQFRRLLALIVPGGLLFAATAPVLVTLVYEYGEFGAGSAELADEALDGFVIGVIPLSLSFLFFRAMQTLSRLRRLVQIAAAALVLNAIASILLAIEFGLFGVTLATALVSLPTLYMQMRSLSSTFGRSWLRSELLRLGPPLLAAAATGTALVIAYRSGWISEWQRLGYGTALAAVAALISVVVWRTRFDG